MDNALCEPPTRPRGPFAVNAAKALCNEIFTIQSLPIKDLNSSLTAIDKLHQSLQFHLLQSESTIVREVDYKLIANAESFQAPSYEHMFYQHGGKLGVLALVLYINSRGILHHHMRRINDSFQPWIVDCAIKLVPPCWKAWMKDFNPDPYKTKIELPPSTIKNYRLVQKRQQTLPTYSPIGHDSPEQLKLQALSPQETELLSILTFLAPTSIPLTLLKIKSGFMTFSCSGNLVAIDSTPLGPKKILEALQPLHSKGLVLASETEVTVDPAIRKYIHDSTIPNYQSEIKVQIAILLYHRYPISEELVPFEKVALSDFARRVLIMYRYFSRSKSYLPHAQCMLQYLEKPSFHSAFKLKELRYLFTLCLAISRFSSSLDWKYKATAIGGLILRSLPEEPLLLAELSLRKLELKRLSPASYIDKSIDINHNASDASNEFLGTLLLFKARSLVDKGRLDDALSILRAINLADSQRLSKLESDSLDRWRLFTAIVLRFKGQFREAELLLIALDQSNSIRVKSTLFPQQVAVLCELDNTAEARRILDDRRKDDRFPTQVRHVERRVRLAEAQILLVEALRSVDRPEANTCALFDQAIQCYEHLRTVVEGARKGAQKTLVDYLTIFSVTYGHAMVAHAQCMSMPKVNKEQIQAALCHWCNTWAMREEMRKEFGWEESFTEKSICYSWSILNHKLAEIFVSEARVSISGTERTAYWVGESTVWLPMLNKWAEGIRLEHDKDNPAAFVVCNV